MFYFPRMILAESVVLVSTTKATLVADVDKMARMIGNSFLHADVGVRSPSGPDLIV